MPRAAPGQNTRHMDVVSLEAIAKKIVVDQRRLVMLVRYNVGAGRLDLDQARDVLRLAAIDPDRVLLSD